MHMIVRGCIAAVTLVAAGVAGWTDVSAQQMVVGQRLNTGARINPSVAKGQGSVLRLILERLPEDAISPLSLEILIGRSESSDVLPLTTISFYSVPPSQITTFWIPLPEEALGRARGGKLPLEFRLNSSGKPEAIANAKVDIKSVAVEPAQAQ